MSKKLELQGKKFGRLSVIREATKQEREENNKKDSHTYWWCNCDCGTKNILINGQSLRRGLTKSCGCLKSEATKIFNKETKIKDLTNQRFGKLIAIRLATDEEKQKYNLRQKKSYWLCQCDCGNTTYACGVQLTKGQIKSCGCLRSYGEELIGRILIENNIDFQKEYCFNDLFGDYGQLKFDFAIFKNEELIGLIECDGIFHRRQTAVNDLERYKRYDELKNNYCRKHSIPLLRIEYNTEEDVKEDEILDFIRSNI